MVPVIVATGPADPGRGWGNMVGLGVAIVVCYLIWRIDLYRRKRKGDDPSPTPGGVPLPRETSQVAGVSSHPSHAETPDDGGAWYGRIVHAGGKWYRTGQHIARTGESPPELPPEPEPELPGPSDDGPLSPERYVPPVGDPETDVPFAEEAGEWPAVEGGGGYVAVEPVVVHRESRDEYARRCLQERVPPPRIVEGLQQHYGLSRATAYRIVQAFSGTQAV